MEREFSKLSPKRSAIYKVSTYNCWWCFYVLSILVIKRNGYKITNDAKSNFVREFCSDAIRQQILHFQMANDNVIYIMFAIHKQMFGPNIQMKNRGIDFESS